jgi:hypothetical protein
MWLVPPVCALIGVDIRLTGHAFVANMGDKPVGDVVVMMPESGVAPMSFRTNLGRLTVGGALGPSYTSSDDGPVHDGIGQFLDSLKTGQSACPELEKISQ